MYMFTYTGRICVNVQVCIQFYAWRVCAYVSMFVCVPYECVYTDMQICTSHTDTYVCIYEYILILEVRRVIELQPSLGLVLCGLTGSLRAKQPFVIGSLRAFTCHLSFADRLPLLRDAFDWKERSLNYESDGTRTK